MKRCQNKNTNLFVRSGVARIFSGECPGHLTAMTPPPPQKGWGGRKPQDGNEV